MIVLYHRDDLDGICSAAIINRFLKTRNEVGEFIGMSYSDLEEFDISKLDKNQQIVVIDFSLKEKDMRILQQEQRLIWIDHHISSMETLKDIQIPGIRSIGTAACYLAWRYFFTLEEIPTVVSLLSDYDIWNHENKNVLPFQYGMKLKKLNYNSTLWDVLFNEDNNSSNVCADLIEIGEAILEYQTSQNEEYCNAASFETTLVADKRYKVLACNALFTGSKLFDSKWDPEKYDCMMTFGWRGNKWQVSFYTNNQKDTDCSKLAAYFGGGGHFSAAGCMVSSVEIGKDQIYLKV